MQKTKYVQLPLFDVSPYTIKREIRPAPKPSKAERADAKQSQISSLKEYRRVQAALAIDRDGDLCAIHWFKYGKRVLRQDVHHVYGRGRKAGDRKEHYTSLLCLCRGCHSQIAAIKTPGSTHRWVVDILQSANDTPINALFEHVQED